MAGETVVISPTGVDVVSAGPQGPPGPATLTPGAVLTGEGDLIVGGSGGTPTRLPIGSSGKFLKAVSGDPAWATLAVADISDIGTIATQNATAVTVAALTATGNVALGNGDSDVHTMQGRFRKQGAAPTVGLGTGAGTGATGTPTGNDEIMRWLLTTGTTPSANATVATFTFATAKPDTNYIVELIPMDPDAQAAIADGNGIFYDDASRSTTTFQIHVGSGALVASTGYRFGIIVREYA
jgi:hypothetical protein